MLSISDGMILTVCLATVLEMLVCYGHNHIMKFLIHARLVLMPFPFPFITTEPSCDICTELHTV